MMLTVYQKSALYKIAAVLFVVLLPCAESTEFTVDVRHSRCPELTPVPRKNASECAQHCANLEGCDVWQYCDFLSGSCELYENGKYSAGNWTRCFFSTIASSRERCIPERWSRNWIGGATDEFDRIPQKSQEPIASKRGFSGFLKVALEENANLVATAELNPICDDAMALGREESWYYTWQSRTSSSDYCRNQERLWGASPNEQGVRMGGEFVPMLIGVGQADNVLQNMDKFRVEWERANVHFLLGYNEPDPSPNHPHEVDAATAALDWVKVQQVADSFDPPLRLVSPCPASEAFDDNGVSVWLDDFFGNCTDVVEECDPSKIEFIAFHDYKGNVELLEQRINGMTQHYGNRQLWLTEYSIGRWEPSLLRPEQDAYMGPSLSLLENHPAIYRYVWFNSRNPPSRWGGVKDLMVWNSSEVILTSTGEIYRDWPEGPSPDPTAEPTHSPTASPSFSPTANPTATPTQSSECNSSWWSQSLCVDDPCYRHKNHPNRSCDLMTNTPTRMNKYCKKKKVGRKCPVSCQKACATGS